ncbi:MAG TPA: hypothetical protein VMP08_13920 [Anaerolineae bacterium]|nr:hypothetical protein [Anaerolineae bacterium]
MSNTNPRPSDSLPDWYDPYPEPNTMPRKWDLSQYGYTDEAAKAKSSKNDKQDTQAA